jgi:hypothetical protein
MQSHKRVKEKILSQIFMGDNMPKVIENIINGEYSDVDILKDECKKLVDSIQVNNNQIDLDFHPE